MEKADCKVICGVAKTLSTHGMMVIVILMVIMMITLSTRQGSEK